MAWFLTPGEERWDNTVRGTHVSVEEKESLLRVSRKPVYFIWHAASVTVCVLFFLNSGRARLFLASARNSP